MTEKKKDKKEDFCLACAAAPALVSAISGAGAAIESKDASKDNTSDKKKDTIIRDVLIGVSVVSAIVAVVMLLKKNGKKRKKRRR